MGGGQAGAWAGGPAAERSLGLGPGPWGGSLSRAPLGPPDIPLSLPSPTCPLACLLRGERHRNPVWPDSFPSPAGLGVGVGVGDLEGLEGHPQASPSFPPTLPATGSSPLPCQTAVLRSSGPGQGHGGLTLGPH